MYLALWEEGAKGPEGKSSHTMECLDRVPDLEIKLGDYTVRDTFYVVDLSDTYVVLGVQWLITLGKITSNYQTLEMGFRDSDRKKIVLRGMSTWAHRTVSAKRMCYRSVCSLGQVT
jgi:hypothetical protein